ncbi:hypothetical protein [Agathobacter rectalis]|nr:hypothetical protein [Agathobacter rectalis]
MFFFLRIKLHIYTVIYKIVKEEDIMAKMRVMVVKYGYAVVDADNADFE